MVVARTLSITQPRMATDYIAGTTLASRAVSAFPLSIGTSLAFESLFPPRQVYYDPQREIPESINAAEYQSCWINVHTLIRNIAGAVDKTVIQHAHTNAITDTLCEEIEVIESLFQNEGLGVCKPFFYYSTYRDIRKIRVPGVSFRDPNTPNQMAFQAMIDNVVRELERRTDEVRVYHDTIRPPSKDVGLIITHYPYDLLSHKSFERLDLLESHTGVLKSKHAWNTKYSPMAGKSFANLPFQKKLLLIFGDRHLIKPMAGKIREVIVDSAEKRNWTPMTTEDKVKLDLSLDLLDPVHFQVFSAL